MRSEGEVGDGDEEEGDEIGHLCRGFCFPIFRPKSEISLVSLKSRTPNPTFPVSASRVEEILQDFSFRTRIGLWNNGFSLLGFRKWAFSLTIELASSNSNRVEHFLLIWSGFSFFFFFFFSGSSYVISIEDSELELLFEALEFEVFRWNTKEFAAELVTIEAGMERHRESRRGTAAVSSSFSSSRRRSRGSVFRETSG